MNEFDACAMYAAMDAQRTSRGLSWTELAQALWEQSMVLNRRRQDHPISSATLLGISKRADCTCQHALFILRWLERPPEAFLVLPSTGANFALPCAGDDERLRWNLAAVYAAMNEHRRERRLTWRQLATRLHCTEHQVRGLRTARFAIGMRHVMGIVQWLERPAASFIYAAHW